MFGASVSHNFVSSAVRFKRRQKRRRLSSQKSMLGANVVLEGGIKRLMEWNIKAIHSADLSKVVSCCRFMLLHASSFSFHINVKMPFVSTRLAAQGRVFGSHPGCTRLAGTLPGCSC